MNAKEWFLVISIPVNIILMILAIRTLIKKRNQLRITSSQFTMKITIAVLIPIAGFVISKLS